MRNLLLFQMLMAVLLSSCLKEYDDLRGQWVNLSSNEKFDPVILDFIESEVFMINSRNQLFKRNWEFYQSELIIENECQNYKRYNVSWIGRDTVILTFDNFHHILVKEAVYQDRFGHFSSTNELKKEILDSPWIMDVEVHNGIKSHYIEFLNNGKTLISSFSDSHDDYVFGNVGEWEIVSIDSVLFIRMKNIIDNNVFLGDANDNTLTGVLVNVHTTGSAKNMIGNKLRLIKHPILTSYDKLINTLKGKWKINPPGDIDAYIVFYEEFDQLVMRSSIDDQAYSDIKEVRLSGDGKLLLMNSLESRLRDIIKIDLVELNKLHLGFPGEIANREYVKIDSLVREDDFF